MTRECPACGTTFTLRWAKSPQRCCSISCTRKYEWQNTRKRMVFVEQVCEHCGETFSAWDKAGRRFCSKRCAGTATSQFGEHKGEKNNRYNGGLCIHKGRAMVCCRDGSILWYSRALMAAHIGRLLRSDEIVHHVNGDGSDDRIENLRIVTRSEHINLHRDDLKEPKVAA